MSAIDDILSQIPIDQLARQLGVDEKIAEQATRQVLPALLGGMQANAEDPKGAASLAEAVDEHDGSLLDGGVDLDDVDTKDGAKIVNHVFGEHKAEVVNQLGGLGGLGNAGGDLVKKLLPILAPIVLAWLAKKFGGAAAPSADASATTGSAPQEGGGLGGLGDLLGGLLGGSGGGGAGQVIDILGGLLGAGRK